MPIQRLEVIGATIEAPRQVGFRTFELDRVPESITTKTLESAISPGTVMVAYAPPDEAAEQRIDYPVLKFDYANTAVVTEVRDPEARIQEGARVSVSTGHRTGDIVELKDTHRYIELPDDIDDEVGVLGAQLFPIALAGILTAADILHGREVTTLEGCLAGQRVGVNGAGPIGLILSEALRYAGAEQPIMVDEWPQRMQHAADAGMTLVNFRQVDSVSKEIKKEFSEHRVIRGEDYGPGADFFFNTAPTAHAVNNALDSVRKQGKVIEMAFHPILVPVALGGAFHTEVGGLVSAQINNLPERQRPAWTRRRLAEEGLLIAQDRGVHLKHALFTHRGEFAGIGAELDDYAARNPDRIITINTPGDVSRLPRTRSTSGMRVG